MTMKMNNMKPEDYNLTNWLTEAEIEELNSIIPRPKKNKSNTFTVIRASVVGLLRRKVEDKINGKIRFKLNKKYKAKQKKLIVIAVSSDLYEGFKQLCGERQMSATVRALMVRYIEEKQK